MTVTTNFPPEPTTFVGRHFDMDQLAQLLAVSRVVTLCGIGGIGKTRLALKVGAEIAERFPAGARLVELAGAHQPQELAARVASVLRVSPSADGAHTPEDAVVQAIGDSHALLILDGCDSLLDDCARLCERLLSACRGLRIIATSREPLGFSGETAWRVPPLPLPQGDDHRWNCDLAAFEAMRLFRDRASEARPGFSFTRDNTSGIASLVRRLDGIPLAIELVAATTWALDVEEVGEGISDHFRELGTHVGGGRAALSRRRILAATIDWSHHLLGEPERALLRRVSVFQGGWTLRMAEQVCAGGRLWTEDMLTHTRALIARSLVVADAEPGREPRYHLLGPIRDYAAERLSASGEEDRFRRRHHDYVHRVAEEFDFATRPGLRTPRGALALILLALLEPERSRQDDGQGMTDALIGPAHARSEGRLAVARRNLEGALGLVRALEARQAIIDCVADQAVAYVLEVGNTRRELEPDTSARSHTSDTSRRPRAGPDGSLSPAGTLTAREREIALLIAQGLSNRAIAAELVISSATVARHVANILAKLGFSSRTQVAAWMVEWGAHRTGAKT
jgi:predicted ATPase/DNA-binding CsgD family transcriptional regulator